MKRFYRAEEIFKELSGEFRKKIFEIAAGKLVYFPKNQDKKQITNKDQILVSYAKGKSYSKIGKELGVSKVRIFQIVSQERENFSKERIGFWKDQGLSLREIARLFKKSHETVRQGME